MLEGRSPESAASQLCAAPDVWLLERGDVHWEEQSNLLLPRPVYTDLDKPVCFVFFLIDK